MADQGGGGYQQQGGSSPQAFNTAFGGMGGRMGGKIGGTGEYGYGSGESRFGAPAPGGDQVYNPPIFGPGGPPSEFNQTYNPPIWGPGGPGGAGPFDPRIRPGTAPAAPASAGGPASVNTPIDIAQMGQRFGLPGGNGPTASGEAPAPAPVMNKIGGGPVPVPNGPMDVSQYLANPGLFGHPVAGSYGAGPNQVDMPLSMNPNWKPNPGNVFDFSGFGKKR